VLSSLLLYALLFAGIGVVVFAGTLVLQGAIYSEPVSQLYWRAPVAGLILTLFFAAWCYLAYRSPGSYNTLFAFTTSYDESTFEELTSYKRGNQTLYKRNKTSKDYRDSANNKWRRSGTDGVVDEIVVEDKKDGQKFRFHVELGPDGNFKSEPARFVEVGGKGRVMLDNDIGHLSSVRWGLIFGNILLNIVHLVLWFAALWLILRFQWLHAFGLALVLWLIVTFAIMPMLFKRAEDAARSPGRTMARATTLVADTSAIRGSDIGILTSMRGCA
jgi:hypothetical protein